MQCDATVAGVQSHIIANRWLTCDQPVPPWVTWHNSQMRECWSLVDWKQNPVIDRVARVSVPVPERRHAKCDRTFSILAIAWDATESQLQIRLHCRDFLRWGVALLPVAEDRSVYGVVSFTLPLQILASGSFYNYGNSCDFVRGAHWTLTSGALGTGESHSWNPLFVALPQMQHELHGCPSSARQSRCPSLPAQPAEIHSDTLVNAPTGLLLCVTGIRRTRLQLRKWHQVWLERDARWFIQSVNNACVIWQAVSHLFYSGRNCDRGRDARATGLSHRSAANREVKKKKETLFLNQRLWIIGVVRCGVGGWGGWGVGVGGWGLGVNGGGWEVGGVGLGVTFFSKRQRYSYIQHFKKL